MAPSDSPTLHNEIDKRQWTATEKLWPNLDRAIKRHGVVELIFLKYVSGLFDQGQSEHGVMEHGGSSGDVVVCGQEINPTTWRPPLMNVATFGIDLTFCKNPVDTFTRDHDPDLRAGLVFAHSQPNDVGSQQNRR